MCTNICCSVVTLIHFGETDRCTPTRWAKFKFSGPHCIFHSAICYVSETPEHQKIQNWVKRGVSWPELRDLHFKFFDPLNISGMIAPTNFKFGIMHIDCIPTFQN